MSIDPHHLGERKFQEYPRFFAATARDPHHVLHIALWSLLATAAVVATAAVILG
jgi:hypothetical protein